MYVCSFCNMLISEPGIHHGNEDSRGSENRKSSEKCFVWKKIESMLFFFYEN